jgi:outer membrane protein assembly factor BamE
MLANGHLKQAPRALGERRAGIIAVASQTDRAIMPRIAVASALAASLLLLAGCQSVANVMPRYLKPYEPDVQQGNVVTKEMVDQLAPGMSREQVRFLLGTPMLTSIFHLERWDYVYRLQRGNSGEVQSRRMVVYFKDHRLDHFDADQMPPEAMADNLILGRSPKSEPTPPPTSAPLRSRDVDPQTEVDIIAPKSPTERIQ